MVCRFKLCTFLSLGDRCSVQPTARSQQNYCWRISRFIQMKRAFADNLLLRLDCFSFIIFVVVAVAFCSQKNSILCAKQQYEYEIEG